MANHIHVFTYKEGLLSRVAHDLRLHVEPRGIEVKRSGEQVTATMDPTALIVDGAMSGSQLDDGALDERDRRKIVETMRREILDTQRFTSIRFTGKAVARGERALDVDGELELVGVRRPLAFTATREGRRIRARVTLQPSRWGIRPYKALAGAIRLQDRLTVEIDLDESE
ncbi:MAG TPA: YceI family protein [Enhygromyxa sp.]|nr:YceI family protein [Enhygromyxa sp.]